MRLQSMLSIASLKQFAPAVLSTLFTRASVQHVLVGGWSLGVVFALVAAVELEVCIAGARGVFALDARGLSPRVRVETWISLSEILGRGTLSREWVHATTDRVTKNLQFAEMPMLRFNSTTFAFTCPIMADELGDGFQDDRTVNARVALC